MSENMDGPPMRAAQMDAPDGPRCWCGKVSAHENGWCGVCGTGCCRDRACTAETCMALPKGTTCGHCAHERRCVLMFGMEPTDTSCSFFPRRFRAKDTP